MMLLLKVKEVLLTARPTPSIMRACLMDLEPLQVLVHQMKV